MNARALKILAATKLLPLLLLLALPQSGWAQNQFYVKPFYYQIVGAYNQPGAYAIIYHYDDSEGANVTIPTTVSSPASIRRQRSRWESTSAAFM